MWATAKPRCNTVSWRILDVEVFNNFRNFAHWCSSAIYATGGPAPMAKKWSFLNGQLLIHAHSECLISISSLVHWDHPLFTLDSLLLLIAAASFAAVPCGLPFPGTEHCCPSAFCFNEWRFWAQTKQQTTFLRFYCLFNLQTFYLWMNRRHVVLCKRSGYGCAL